MHDSFRHFSILAQERNILVGRYVIMSDHVHFFVYFGDAMQISVWMKSLKNSLSKTLRCLGKLAPHWQKGYFDHLVRSEQSYEEKWIYVEQNPMRKKLVSEACDWPYQGEIAPLSFD
jgi:REP element-mobilizing transposase RayT